MPKVFVRRSKNGRKPHWREQPSSSGSTVASESAVLTSSAAAQTDPFVDDEPDDFMERFATSGDLNADTEQLERLVFASEPGIRMRASETLVADGREISYGTLKRMTLDTEPEVRVCAARYPDTSGKMLRFLSTDKDRDVRQVVAAHRSSPYDTVQTLAKDPEENVRKSARARMMTHALDEIDRMVPEGR